MFQSKLHFSATLTKIRLEDFLSDEEIEVIKESSMTYMNLGELQNNGT